MAISPTIGNLGGTSIPTEICFDILPTDISDFTITFIDDLTDANVTLTKSDFTLYNNYLYKHCDNSISSFKIKTKDIYRNYSVSTQSKHDGSILEVYITFTDPGSEKLYAWKDPDSTPNIVYTDSPTLTNSMIIYDNKGNSTEYVVYKISENSFSKLSTSIPPVTPGGGSND